MVSASDLTFGVEIETILPYARAAEINIGDYHRGVQVPYLPAGWKAERDGSLNGNGAGCELVSPVLRGVEGIEQVVDVLRILAEKGHTVNASCGVHVHVEWNPMLPSQTLARLITMVSHLEAGLYAITGTKSRERGSYCGGIRKYANPASAKRNAECSRYHILNLTNLARGVRPAVEFRAFSGSLNAIKVVGWIQTCIGIVQRAVNGKRNANWSPKPPSGGWKKAGPGASECERLIGFLAWGEGYAKIHGGVHFGWLSTSITEERVKTEFRRMAAKYDEMA